MKRLFLYCFFLLAALLPTRLLAQNIDGDTVFINTYVEAQITFPGDIEDARFIPIDTYKEVQFPIQGTYILLHSKIENSKKAILMIKEGGREHRFIVVYKKNINQYDFREYTYNYKTLKLLKKHLEESAQKSGGYLAVADKTPSHSGKKNDNPPKTDAAAGADNTPDYYALIEKGNDAFKKEAYDDALGIYQHARAIKPTDDIAQIKIDQTQAKLAEVAKAEQADNEKKFNDLKNEARSYLDRRQYDKAKEAFEKAKYIMPGDGYAIRQIENINKLIAQEAEQKKAQELLNQYNNYIAEGEKDLADKKLPEAEAAFRNALSVKQYDKKALTRLQTIDDLKKQQAINDELEARYTATLASADKLLNEADYNDAVTEYNNALRIFPRSYPKDKIRAVTQIISDRIKEVNRILADQRTQEAEKKRILALQRDTTEKYNNNMSKADAAFKINNYQLAKNFYKKAAALKPLEPLPVSQMDIIEIKLGQVAFEKRRREDSIRKAKENDKNYELTMTQAKSYYLKEELLQAKIAYEAAADLKPQKEEPKKQLVVINDKLEQIEKERLLNDRFDSLTAIGDSFLILKQYDQATVNYKAASILKPGSIYPTNQMRYIRSEQKYLADLEAVRLANEEQKKRWEAAEKKYRDELRFMAAKKRGDSAVAAKNWGEALKAFNEALTIHPDNKYILDRSKPVQYQYDQQKLAEDKLAAQKKEEEDKSSKDKKKKKRKKDKTEETTEGSNNN